MSWLWIAFEDLSAPRGQRAVGAMIIEKVNGDLWVAMNHAQQLLGPLPDYECHVAEVDERYGPPPLGTKDRFLPHEEARRIATVWTGGVATASQVRDAFLDDEARPGDPLFRAWRPSDGVGT